MSQTNEFRRHVARKHFTGVRQTAEELAGEVASLPTMPRDQMQSMFLVLTRAVADLAHALELQAGAQPERILVADPDGTLHMQGNLEEAS